MVNRQNINSLWTDYFINDSIISLDKFSKIGIRKFRVNFAGKQILLENIRAGFDFDNLKLCVFLGVSGYVFVNLFKVKYGQISSFYLNHFFISSSSCSSEITSF